MTESEVVSVGKRRSRREINRLVVEFESSGLRQSEFCHKHGLALSTLQRGHKRRRKEVGGQSGSNPLVEVKVTRTKVDRSGPETRALEVVLGRNPGGLRLFFYPRVETHRSIDLFCEK
jgi:hypothetical protein